MTGVAWAFKLCPKCETAKNTNEFGSNPAKSDGLSHWCRVCRRAWLRHWNKVNPHVLTERHDKWVKENRDKVALHARKYTWKWRNIDITEEEYQRRHVESGGVCAICGRPETTKSSSGEVRELSLDHDHETGRARGLLCSLCNVAFARVDLVPDWPERLIAYRNKWMGKLNGAL